MTLDTQDETTIKEIITKYSKFDIEDIKDSDILDVHLCMDSLDIIEMVMDIEKEFDVTIYDDETDALTTVESIYELLSIK